MEEVIIIVLQFLLEFFFNVCINLPFDWPSSKRTTPESEKVAETCFVLFCIGCGIAMVSLLFFKHTLIFISALRIMNLFLSPITAAYISQFIAKRSAKANSNIIPRNHFWQAFWFTVGFVAVRFAYVVHGCKNSVKWNQNGAFGFG